MHCTDCLTPLEPGRGDRCPACVESLARPAWYATAAILLGFAGRIAAQSELLTERAEVIEPDPGWLCNCGNWIDDGLHCDLCLASPPWGCPCSGCQDGDSEEDYGYCEYGDVP